MGALLELEEANVQEEFFERGWSDGLPVVPPTPERVEAMLAAGGVDEPQTLIGYLSVRDRGVTLEQAATNAVMAGCRPEYFPIVVAALEAMFDPSFNLNTVLTSTGGAALCVIVSGPLAAEIGMNGRHNCLGHGNRANLTIGRALRLVATNALGSVPGCERRLVVRPSRQGQRCVLPRILRRRHGIRCPCGLGYSPTTRP
jgi:hypothetical protein